MKHVFYIHSYITYFVSLEIIKYRRLKRTDCIFMYGRSFRPVEAGGAEIEVNIPFTHYPQSSFSIERKFWRSWSKLANFDRYVWTLTKGLEFHLYTNQTGIDFIGLFISHGRCSGFSFIEEGLYSYYNFDFINSVLCPPIGKPSAFYKLLILLNYGSRLEQQKSFLASGYEAVYGINTAAFPGFRNRNIMPFPFDVVKNDDDSGEQAVLVLDSFLDYGIISWDKFERALKKVFEFFQDNEMKQLLIKFHPKQYENPEQLHRSKELVNKLKKEIIVVEVDQEQSLEMLAANPHFKNLSFYVFLSSAALYAALCGRKAYSFAPFLAKDDTEYKARIKDVPKIFKNIVRFIQN